MGDNKTGTYLKYAIGEIILVVIGILIALSINNWNEKSKLKTEEIKLLKEMKSALLSDKADILSNIEEHSSAEKSCSILIAHLSKELPYADSLDIHFANSLNTTRFGHTSSSYETLKTKGPDLIENDSLRLMLGNYYDKKVGYQFELQKMSSEGFNTAKQRQFDLFKSLRFWDTMKPVDYNALVKNTYYMSWLTYTEGERKWEATSFRTLGEMNDELVHLISDELKGED
jgi:hypothetical protein